MDPKTERILRQVSANIPQHLLDRIHKTGKNEVKEKAEAMASDRKVSQTTRDKIRGMIDSGIYDKFLESDQDPEVAAEIEKYLYQKIRYLVDMGIIEEPKEDEWTRKIRRKLE